MTDRHTLIHTHRQTDMYKHYTIFINIICYKYPVEESLKAVYQ